MGLLDHSFKGDILICCFDFGIISNFQGLLTCPSRLELILLGTEVSPRGPSKTRPKKGMNKNRLGYTRLLGTKFPQGNDHGQNLLQLGNNAGGPREIDVQRRRTPVGQR